MRITIKEIVIETEDSETVTTPPPPAEVPAGKVLLETRTVADCTMNKESEFWKHHIGKIVGVIKQTPDGLMDIQLPEQLIPIEGVDPKRLT